MSEAQAPFTDEQIKSLNDYQVSGVFHPFTCGIDSVHALLVAGRDGWSCPDCEYKQTWAHVWMANDMWRRAARVREV